MENDSRSSNGNKIAQMSDRLVIISAEGVTDANTLKNLNLYIKSYLEKVDFPSASLTKFWARTPSARRTWFTGNHGGLFRVFFEFWEGKLRYRQQKFVGQPSFMGEPWAGYPKPQSPGGPKLGFQFILEVEDKEKEESAMMALAADIEKYLKMMGLEEEATYFTVKLAPKTKIRYDFLSELYVDFFCGLLDQDVEKIKVKTEN